MGSPSFQVWTSGLAWWATCFADLRSLLLFLHWVYLLLFTSTQHAPEPPWWGDHPFELSLQAFCAPWFLVGLLVSFTVVAPPFVDAGSCSLGDVSFLEIRESLHSASSENLCSIDSAVTFFS